MGAENRRAQLKGFEKARALRSRPTDTQRRIVLKCTKCAQTMSGRGDTLSRGHLGNTQLLIRNNNNTIKISCFTLKKKFSMPGTRKKSQYIYIYIFLK